MPCKNSIEKSGLGSCTAKFIVDIESTCTEIADVNIECGAGFKYDTNNYIFHAGTKIYNNKIQSIGGRVLNFVCISEDFKSSRNIAIKRIDELRWSNGFYRKDIGYKVID